MNTNIISIQSAGGRSGSGIEEWFFLFEHLPIGLLVVDQKAHIVFLNEYVAHVLGYQPKELLGQPIEILVPERSRTGHADMRRMFGEAPKERPMGTGRDLVARHRDGSEIAVEIGLKPIKVQGLEYVLATMVDIRERKRLEELQRLLIGELNHRIQNLFSVVQSVAQSSLSEKRSLTDSREVFIERLQSLGRAYAIMTAQEWQGAPLRQLLEAETSAFAERVNLNGPDIMVRQKTAQSFALLLHELTTNAIKYGSLSTPAGRVQVHWKVGSDNYPDLFVLSWEEIGGPALTAPSRAGFGTKIIKDTMRRIGRHEIEYAPSGLKFHMGAPIEKVGWVIEPSHP